MKATLLLFIVALCYLNDTSAQTTISTCGSADQPLRISETLIDSPVSNFMWIVADSDDSVVFARTEANTVWRSGDEGQTWAQQTGVGFSIGVDSMYRSASDDVIYFLSTNLSSIAVTTDRGVTYTEYLLPGKVLNNPIAFFVHPTSKSHVAIVTDDYQLWITSQYGLEWSLSSTQYTLQFSWANAGSTGVSENSFLYSHYDNGVWVLYHWDGRVSTQKLTDISGFVYLTRGVLYVVQNTRNNANQATQSLVVSEDYGTTFHTAIIPNHESQDFYHILEVQDGVIFVGIVHSSQTGYVNIYSSDAITGANYTLSLKYTSRGPATKIVDFMPVRSLQGVFLANQYTNIPATNGYTRTLITFNEGGSWQPIGMPYDATGKVQQTCPTDQPDCSLHLHTTKKSDSTVIRNAGGLAFGPLHSNRNTVGMILATGNVGPSLSSRLEDAKTYLSNDAGWTWMEIGSKSYVYEFADRGAIIAMADSLQQTSEILYSWNQGLSFLTCDISKFGAIEVDDITADPSRTSQIMTVLGSRIVNGVNKGVIITMDFSSMHERDCKHPDDYVHWVPQGINNTCILGQRKSYLRRNRTAECFNADTEERPDVTTCPCDVEDYECDVCYQNIGGICSFDEQCDPNFNQPPTPCVGVYSVSRGYRLIPNTKCELDGGLNLLPELVQCPPTPPTTGPTPTSTPDNHDHQQLQPLRPSIVVVIVLFSLLFCGIVLFLVTPKGRKIAKTFFGRVKGRKSQHRELFNFEGDDEEDEEEVAYDPNASSNVAGENLADSLRNTGPILQADDEFDPRV